MLQALNDLIMALMDPLLGWMLSLPSDAILFIVGIGTSVILTGVRLFTTDQDLLGRCDQDKTRLNPLIKEAKKSGDKDALKRYRDAKAMIAMKVMKFEGKPLLAALVPIALLGTWCFWRIEVHPPKAQEPVEVRAYFPVSAAGKLVHLVPEEGLQAVQNSTV